MEWWIVVRRTRYRRNTILGGHTHTQLHYITRDNVLSPLIWHSVQCTSGGIVAIVTPGGSDPVFPVMKEKYIYKLMDLWGVRANLSQEWCTYAIMPRRSGSWFSVESPTAEVTWIYCLDDVICCAEWRWRMAASLTVNKNPWCFSETRNCL